jgi:protein ImuA
MNRLTGKKEMIRQLKEKLLAMEGFSTGPDSRQPDFGLGPVNASFPGGVFPTSAVHEFISPTETCSAAANGFIAGLLSTLLKKGGICLWISAGRKLFPPALKFFGIEPHRIIFIDVRREKDALWVMEQALKCNALAAVVGELWDISFSESRRLQLAAGESRITGFLHRRYPYTANTLASVSRWKISPIASQLPDKLPGVEFPRWKVELEKIRNGKPGVWQIEWRNGTFRHLPVQKQVVPDSEIAKRKKHYA